MGDHVLVAQREVLPHTNPRSVGVLGEVVDEVVTGLDVLGCSGVVIGDNSTPHLVIVDDLQIILGDDTKVARASLESLEKVGVSSSVGIHDGSISQDNLIILNVVTGVSDTCSVESITT